MQYRDPDSEIVAQGGVNWRRKNDADLQRGFKDLINSYNIIEGRNSKDRISFATIEEAVQDYMNVNTARFQNQQDLYLAAQAADRQFGRMTALSILQDNGFSQNGAVALITGNFTPESTTKVDSLMEDLRPEYLALRTQEEKDTYLSKITDASVLIKGMESQLTNLPLDNAQAFDPEQELEDLLIRTGRLPKSTGGEVSELIPNAPSEPDERINKLTGVPYNEGAGAAYMDTDDPLRVLKMNEGGDVEDPTMYRKDGSKKSTEGWIGPMKNEVTGRTMTEFSTDLGDGSGREIPTMVKTQSKEALAYMRKMPEGQGFNMKIPIEREIVDVARREANKRIDAGESQWFNGEEKREGYSAAGAVVKAGMKLFSKTKVPVPTKAAVKKTDLELPALRPYEEVPAPATYDEMYLALNKNKKEKINIEIPEGQEVGLRLDIPAYENKKNSAWVPTIHDEKGTKLTSHRATAALKNVDFSDIEKESMQNKSLRVKEGGQKGPFAKIGGNLINRSDEENYKLAQEALNSDEWTQVGFNPKRHSYYFDRKTGEPVLKGDEAIQVGPLVLVKNAVFGNKKDFKYASGGKVLNTLRRARN